MAKVQLESKRLSRILKAIGSPWISRSSTSRTARSFIKTIRYVHRFASYPCSNDVRFACGPWLSSASLLFLYLCAFSGGSSNTLLTDSRDVSPVSVFGATRNTSPVSHTGRMTPRRSYSPSPAVGGSTAGGHIPIRKNSFVVTESQYAHVLPSVSPRSSSPAIRTGQWSGRVTPSALETWMETSIIATNNSIFSNTPDQAFVNDAQGRSWPHLSAYFDLPSLLLLALLKPCLMPDVCCAFLTLWLFLCACRRF